MKASLSIYVVIALAINSVAAKSKVQDPKVIAKFINKYIHPGLPQITAKLVGDVSYDCAFDMMYNCRQRVLSTVHKFDCIIIENYKDFPKCFGKPEEKSYCARPNCCKDYMKLAAGIKGLCDGHPLSIHNSSNTYYQGPKKKVYLDKIGDKKVT